MVAQIAPENLVYLPLKMISVVVVERLNLSVSSSFFLRVVLFLSCLRVAQVFELDLVSWQRSKCVWSAFKLCDNGYICYSSYHIESCDTCIEY